MSDHRQEYNLEHNDVVRVFLDSKAQVDLLYGLPDPIPVTGEIDDSGGPSYERLVSFRAPHRGRWHVVSEAGFNVQVLRIKGAPNQPVLLDVTHAASSKRSSSGP